MMCDLILLSTLPKLDTDQLWKLQFVLIVTCNRTLCIYMRTVKCYRPVSSFSLN